ncbi:LysR family transcriptional regulator [Paraburkholderia sp. J67]|uniref:LysR family transcriptional regulator n=1 Tax=Paraburkholderia sp. J67 TaxID=2805435 RepID=UPI002ABE5FD3|nr:LysR family transcriptional regulator [Paraburkholderia sp. J67]
MVNLLSLNTLLAVVDSGSMMEAGRTVCRAQSAVSRAIRLLEDEFGTPLLSRSSRGTVLSPAGEAMMPRVRAVMERLAVWNVERRRIGARGIPQVVLNARRLEMYGRLIRCRQMSVVSRQMGISQPAVSFALATLENQAGRPLFERRTSGLEPTDLAYRLGEASCAALNEAAQLADDLSAQRLPLDGRLIVGALPGAGALVLERAMAVLRRVHPGLDVDLIELEGRSTAGLTSTLQSREVDLVVGALRDFRHEDGLAVEPLFGTPLTLVARRGHPLLSCASVSDGARDLTSIRWFVDRHEAQALPMLLRMLAEAGVTEPWIAIERDTAQLAARVADDAAACGVVRSAWAADPAATATLVRVPVALPGTWRDLGVATRADRAPCAAAAALARIVRALHAGDDGANTQANAGALACADSVREPPTAMASHGRLIV